jgi:hypothetical protein
MKIKIKKLIEDIANDTPNDMDLGRKIRKLINAQKEIQTDESKVDGFQ